MTRPAGETPEARLKRLRLRAWRRGTREMDLVLGPFADARLAGMEAGALDALEALMDEADADILSWVLGQVPPPDRHRDLVAALAAHAAARFGHSG